jgi:hypothetical protein
MDPTTFCDLLSYEEKGEKDKVYIYHSINVPPLGIYYKALKWHKTKMYDTFSLRRHNIKYCRFKTKIK